MTSQISKTDDSFPALWQKRTWAPGWIQIKVILEMVSRDPFWIRACVCACVLCASALCSGHCVWKWKRAERKLNANAVLPFAWFLFMSFCLCLLFSGFFWSNFACPRVSHPSAKLFCCGRKKNRHQSIGCEMEIPWRQKCVNNFQGVSKNHCKDMYRSNLKLSGISQVVAFEMRISWQKNKKEHYLEWKGLPTCGPPPPKKTNVVNHFGLDPPQCPLAPAAPVVDWNEALMHTLWVLWTVSISVSTVVSRGRSRILVRGGPGEFWPQGGPWAQNLLNFWVFPQIAWKLWFWNNLGGKGGRAPGLPGSIRQW